MNDNALTDFLIRVGLLLLVFLMGKKLIDYYHSKGVTHYPGPVGFAPVEKRTEA